MVRLNDGLTNTGGGLCSETRLALAYKAARSVHAHISQLTATLLLEAALIHICSGGKPINKKLSFDSLVWILHYGKITEVHLL